MTERDVVEMLRDMRDLDFDLADRIGRREAVDGRIRRIRGRRIAAVALAAVLLVAVGVGVAIAATPGTPSLDPLAQEAERDGLPMSMTQPDGVVYRLVEIDKMTTPNNAVDTPQVPARFGVVSVAAICDPAGAATSDTQAHFTTDTANGQAIGTLACRPGVNLIDLDVSGSDPQGGFVPVGITLDNTTAPGTATDWTFGFYDWVLPAKLTAPAPLPQFPAQLNGWVLQQTFTGTLPGKRSVTFREPAGTDWAYTPVCSLALRYAQESGPGWQDEVTISVDGAPREGLGCPYAQPNSEPLDVQWVQPNPTGMDVTITVNYPAAYDLRAATWEVAIYVKK